MFKAIAAIANIIIGVLLVQTALANNYGVSFHRSNTYDGVESYVSIDTTAITTGWQAAPIGLTNWVIGPYVEVGPTRDCTARSNYDCKLHPYYAFEDQNGTSFVVIKTGINLGENTRYIYRVRLNDTNNEWSIIWCSGNGCQTFDQVYIGSYYLERVAVGGQTHAYHTK